MQLPPELLHRIITFLSHDEKREGFHRTLYSDEEALAKDTLLACSRVSYSVRQATLPFLFHTVAINVRLEHDTEWDPPGSSCSCHRLSELVASVGDVKSVCDNVRELRIHAFCPACCAGIRETDYAPWKPLFYRTIDGNVLLSMLSNFKLLRVLNLQQCVLSWGTSTPWSISVKTPPMLSLDSFSFALGLFRMHIDICTLEPLLRSCARVGRTHFSGFDPAFAGSQGVEDRSTGNYNKFSFPIAITSIAMQHCSQVSGFLNFLASRAAIQAESLDSLEITFGPVSEKDPGSIPVFLRTVASNITRLTFHPALSLPSWPLSYDFGALGFAQCTRLICFTLHFDFRPDMSTTVVPTILRTLRGLSFLRSISFIINSPSDTLDILTADLGKSFMEPIEDAILELGPMERVTVHLELYRLTQEENALHAPLVAEWARTALPRLACDEVLA